MHIFMKQGKGGGLFLPEAGAMRAAMTTSDRIAAVLLWPGNKICDLLGVEGEDHRLILRAFMNLLIYGIISLSVMLILLD